MSARISENFIVHMNSSRTAEEDAHLAVSPDLRRLAYVVGTDKPQYVVVNDQRQRPFDSIMRGSLIFSPDSQRLAYIAQVTQKRFGIPMGHKMLVVVDGKEGNSYDSVAKSTLTFSPDGRQVVYLGKRSNTWYVVLDGEEIGIGSGTARFSPDSKRLAYVTGSAGHQSIVVDGQVQESYDSILTGLLFSPNSKRLAYAAKRGHKVVIVADDREGKLYDGIIAGSPAFSPDSKRLAYGVGVEDKDRGFVGFVVEVVDGQEQPGELYDYIIHNTLNFSPDNKQLAYAAHKDNEEFVILNGKKQKEAFTYVLPDTITFSPNNKRLAYAVKVGREVNYGDKEKEVKVKADKNTYIVVDGNKGEPHYGIGVGHLIFSPNSTKLAYKACTYKTYKADKCERWAVVLDDEKAEDYEGILEADIVFSPRGEHVAYVARNGDQYFLVVDDNVVKIYDDIVTINGGKIIFDSANQLRCVARTGTSVCFVEVTL